MTTLMKRVRELSDLEGFDVEVMDLDGRLANMKVNGEARYDYERAASGSITVSDWKEQRFGKAYPRYKCNVLNSDGTVAHGNTLLSTVRSSYEG